MPINATQIAEITTLLYLYTNWGSKRKTNKNAEWPLLTL